MYIGEINLQKKQVLGRPLVNFWSLAQDCLYPHRRPVSDKKKDDMISLLPFIPPIHHPYYRNLPISLSTRSAATTSVDNESDENDELEYM